ncbi:uncharacterized protein MELLADRAFT_112919 [Melampsora larici-populina 98AG31]|uniref:Uncharacterized protein n=1 Tax=Melampsora larici-populina (strain 98AG31 / pathotype 3-4-7) TaxID=747676 RepID=F4S841_MELLP|nr:uncharacterized protein MELLADRAFT_112919 [Melampsora larici-populina 98AG31]EGF99218.1 hypothetical protein MELLADRAFT_112919 [Melampsora larici-populina 98AG31]
MAAGLRITADESRQSSGVDPESLQMAAIRSLYGEVVKGLSHDVRNRQGPGAPGSRRPSSQFLQPVQAEPTARSSDETPLLHLKLRVSDHNWVYSSKLTTLYLDVLTEIASAGSTFEHEKALHTGIGKGSIQVEILKGLLSGDAQFLVTTS